MKKSAVVIAAPVVAASVLLLVGIGPSTASAHGSPKILPRTSAVGRLLAEQLELHPGGKIVGNTVVYPDGSGFAARVGKPDPKAQCVSGEYCAWSNANFSGLMYYTSTPGLQSWSGGSARSYYNHRAQAARLYTSTGTVSTCFTAGHTVATALPSYYLPKKVYLSSTTKC
jgi:Peptidase inhibitor family I36